MTDPSLPVKNGEILMASGLVKSGICVKNGVIATIGMDSNFPQAGNAVDASGKILIPGLIDTLCH